MTGEQKRETRIVRCPACQRYYRVAGGPPAPGMRLRCSNCGEVFSPATANSAAGAARPQEGVHPAPAPGAALVAPAPEPHPVPAASDRGRVLVSTDGVDLHSLIAEVLTAASFSLRQARTGEEAWAAIGSWRPQVVLLDVGLPGDPAFAVCDRVRADKGLHGIGLILIASVFQQTRYKRAPTSLYGADDYIEKHHIRDWLPGKVLRLLSAGAVSAEAAAAPAPPRAATAEPHPVSIDEREQETLIREEISGPASRERQGLPRQEERLRRYARIIISDIALYNQELVERGLSEGTFSELLQKEIEEGHRLYLARVPAATGGEDYYHEAVRNFIARRTGEQGGGISRQRRQA